MKKEFHNRLRGLNKQKKPKVQNINKINDIFKEAMKRVICS